MPETHDRQADIKALTRLPTRGGYFYGPFLEAAYEHSGRAREAFPQLTVGDVSFADLEVRILGERDVPLLQPLVNELRLHLGERRSGPIFRSRQGGRGVYSKRRIQQVVRQTAEAAGIEKRVYPHLLRHTARVQHLADRGCRRTFCSSFSATRSRRPPKSTTSRGGATSRPPSRRQ